MYIFWSTNLVKKEGFSIIMGQTIQQLINLFMMVQIENWRHWDNKESKSKTKYYGKNTGVQIPFNTVKVEIFNYFGR